MYVEKDLIQIIFLNPKNPEKKCWFNVNLSIAKNNLGSLDSNKKLSSTHLRKDTTYK